MRVPTVSVWVCAPLVTALMITAPRTDASACTSVIMGTREQTLLGQNYDFAYSHGSIFVNGSRKRKTSLGNPNELSLEWTSRYSSVVFSQFGKELPTSGMNEAGLTIQLLWNEDGPFPWIDAKTTASLNELQWVQYQLDNHTTLGEVIESLKKIPIKKSYADLHYVVCDAGGACALLEYENSQLKVIRRNSGYTPSVVTNSSWTNTKKFYESVRSSKSLDEIPKKKTSLNVSARASWLVEHTDDSNLTPDARKTRVFEILKESSLDYEFGDLFNWLIKNQPPSVTAWSAVFSPSEKWIEFFSNENSLVRRLDLKTLFRSCAAPDLAMNLDAGSSRQINSLLTPDVLSENTRIIRASYGPIKKNFPEQVQNDLIKYPSTFACAD